MVLGIMISMSTIMVMISKVFFWKMV
jgi:hypothetical protein